MHLAEQTLHILNLLLIINACIRKVAFQQYSLISLRFLFIFCLNALAFELHDHYRPPPDIFRATRQIIIDLA